MVSLSFTLTNRKTCTCHGASHDMIFYNRTNNKYLNFSILSKLQLSYLTRKSNHWEIPRCFTSYAWYLDLHISNQAWHPKQVRARDLSTWNLFHLKFWVHSFAMIWIRIVSDQRNRCIQTLGRDLFTSSFDAPWSKQYRIVDPELDHLSRTDPLGRIGHPRHLHVWIEISE